MVLLRRFLLLLAPQDCAPCVNFTLCSPWRGRGLHVALRTRRPTAAFFAPCFAWKSRCALENSWSSARAGRPGRPGAARAAVPPCPPEYFPAQHQLVPPPEQILSSGTHTVLSVWQTRGAHAYFWCLSPYGEIISWLAVPSFERVLWPSACARGSARGVLLPFLFAISGPPAPPCLQASQASQASQVSQASEASQALLLAWWIFSN